MLINSKKQKKNKINELFKNSLLWLVLFKNKTFELFLYWKPIISAMNLDKPYYRSSTEMRLSVTHFFFCF